MFGDGSRTVTETNSLQELVRKTFQSDPRVTPQLSQKRRDLAGLNSAMAADEKSLYGVSLREVEANLDKIREKLDSNPATL